ncbi:MAG: hypothetical protein KGN34_15470 [Sphingomonadales bacterium]|nr:hypothetical protein [Sphingomonadales bacterium]
MLPRVLLALALAGFLAGLARFTFLHVFRTAVRARLVDCLLGADELRHERRKLATDREHRRVPCLVEYVVAGRTYRGEVSLGSREGEKPDVEQTVWIDPNDPTRVTGRGPGSAVWLMVGSLVWIFAMRPGA